MAIGIGALVYTPTLRKQIQVVESDGPGSDEYRRLSRGTVAGIAAAVIVVIIVFLMVTKPTL